eukprot:jgi/Chlat1/7954/Chrsp69S07390
MAVSQRTAVMVLLLALVCSLFASAAAQPIFAPPPPPPPEEDFFSPPPPPGIPILPPQPNCNPMADFDDFWLMTSLSHADNATTFAWIVKRLQFVATFKSFAIQIPNEVPSNVSEIEWGPADQCPGGVALEVIGGLRYFVWNCGFTNTAQTVTYSLTFQGILGVEPRLIELTTTNGDVLVGLMCGVSAPSGTVLLPHSPAIAIPEPAGSEPGTGIVGNPLSKNNCNPLYSWTLGLPNIYILTTAVVDDKTNTTTIRYNFKRNQYTDNIQGFLIQVENDIPSDTALVNWGPQGSSSISLLVINGLRFLSFNFGFPEASEFTSYWLTVPGTADIGPQNFVAIVPNGGRISGLICGIL